MPVQLAWRTACVPQLTRSHTPPYLILSVIASYIHSQNLQYTPLDALREEEGEEGARPPCANILTGLLWDLVRLQDSLIHWLVQRYVLERLMLQGSCQLDQQLCCLSTLTVCGLTKNGRT